MYLIIPIVLYFIIADDAKNDETFCTIKKLKFYLNIDSPTLFLYGVA